jgi:hypothetical protein
MKKNIVSHLCIIEKLRILQIHQTYTEKKPEMTFTVSKGRSTKLRTCMQSHMEKNIVSHLNICERLRILRIHQTYTEKKPEMTLTLSKGRSIKLKTCMQSDIFEKLSLTSASVKD